MQDEEDENSLLSDGSYTLRKSYERQDIGRNGVAELGTVAFTYAQSAQPTYTPYPEEERSRRIRRGIYRIDSSNFHKVYRLYDGQG